MVVVRDRHKWVAGVAAMLIASACGQGTDVPPPGAGAHASGSRLRAQVLTTDDGARVFQGRWSDRELDDIACRFALATDGTTRCLPVSFARSQAYSDSQCLNMLQSFEGDPVCPTAVTPAFMTFQTDDDPSRTRVSRLGERVEPGAPIYEWRGECTATVADVVYFAEGELVSPDVFAAARVVSSDGQPRAVYWLGSDGAYEHAGWENRTSGMPCEFRRFSDDEVVCIPDGSPRLSQIYADEACEIPLAVVWTTEIPTVAYCHDCEPGQRLFAIGEAFSGAIVYAADASTCVAVERTESGSYYFLGDPIDASQLGEARLRTPTEGPPRIQPAWHITTDEGYTEDSDFLMTDTALAARCFFALASDNQLRCIPLGQSSFLGYSDAACTIAEGRFLRVSGGEPPPTFAYDRDFPGCTTRYTYFPIGPRLDSGPAYRTIGGTCVQNNATSQHYAVGTEPLDPSMFERGQLAIE